MGRKKFESSLSYKLDQAEEKWQQAQPTKVQEWQTKETGTFGQDDWSISTSYKIMERDD